MNLKRLFCLLCALSLLVLCFGCGKTPEEEEQGDMVYSLRVDGAQREYKIGEKFSDVVTITLLGRRNGKVAFQRPLAQNEYTVDSSSFDNTQEGDYTIRVRKKDDALETSFTVTVRKLKVVGAELSGQRVLFWKGDAFETGNATLTLKFEDKTLLELPVGDCAVDSSAFSSDRAGAYEISLTPENYAYTHTYTVYVKEDTMPDYGDSIRILAIGNSFSQDAMKWLYDIYRGYGYRTVELANLMFGGCSLAQHRSHIVNQTAAYEFEQNTNGSWHTDAERRTVDYGIDFCTWDIIVIQQVSGYAGDAASYGEDFAFLVDYVTKRVADKPTRLYWQMTWAYQADSNHGGFVKYGNDQMTMYRAITDTVQSVVTANRAVSGVIPTATAVQNMRTGTLGDTLTRDGFHLNLNYGRYLAGLTWACALTGEDPTQAVAAGGVTQAQLAEIKTSVSYAIASPYAVTSIKG